MIDLDHLIDHDLIDAVIFDCDGTLVDTMRAHFAAWNHALAVNGAEFSIDWETFRQWGGIAAHQVVRMLNEQHGAILDTEYVRVAKQSHLEHALGNTEEIEVIATFARKLHGNTPIAVASGGHPDNVRASLTAAGLRPLFPDELIITPMDVEHGKPAPDMFLLAAERLGVAPERCLVVEDGPPGIEGAKAAGMHWLFLDEHGTPLEMSPGLHA